MTQPSPESTTITRLLDAVYPSFALLAGMELDLFTPLADGPLTADTLASQLGVAADKLRPLLYVLVNTGLLTVDDGRFANTTESDRFLVRDRPDYLGGMAGLTASNWGRILRTADTIRAGGPVAGHDYVEATFDDQVALLRGLYPGAVRDAERLMEQDDFTTYGTLLDVGGGSGALAITLAQAHPNLWATVSDLPSVTPITRHFVGEADATDRVAVVDGNAVSESPAESYDVIVARHLIQVLSPDENRTLLRNLAEALNPGGVLHLIGWVLDDSHVSPANTAMYNLILLTAYREGQAYTEQEYRDWLAEAGLAAIERVTFPDGSSLVTARNAG